MSDRAYRKLTGSEVHPSKCDHPEIEAVDMFVGEFRRCTPCRQLDQGSERSSAS